MIYAKTLSDIERAAKTPAGGGDISPAPAVPATSLEVRSTAGDAGVVEQRTADDSPLSVGSDEICNNPFGLDFRTIHDDDSDQHAFPRSRRLICSASTDGQVTVHRKGECGLALTAEEAHTLYEFLADAARIWGKAIA
jgi:hypothetical protein